MGLTLLFMQAKAEYSFASIGDWGGANLGSYKETNEKAVAKQMGETAAELGIKLVVNTGDNFYYCGVESLTDKQFKIDFEDVFTHSSLSVPWYGVLGNHDYAYDPEYQLKYKSPNNDRWQMPARYFSKQVALSATQNASFIFLDTNPCFAAYRGTDPSKYDPCSPEYKDECLASDNTCHFHQHIVAEDCGAQYSWLKSTLASIPKDDWIIAVGHHPANEIDVNDLTGLLLSKPIHLYLNGHTHALAHYHIDGNTGVDFVLTGAGCMVSTHDQEGRGPQNKTLSQTGSGHSYDEKWYKKVSGFTTHTFSSDFSSLTTKFIGTDGSELYTLTTQKNGATPTPGPSPGPSPRPSPRPSPAPSPRPSPGPSGKCCHWKDSSCSSGDVCCKSDCEDASSCSYTETSCSGHYGQVHKCNWNGKKCVVGSGSATIV